MNEKRKPVETEPELGPPASRTHSDVAPKEVRSGVAARHDSGFRPAVHIPPPPATPVDLHASDLLDDGWDAPADDDSGETLFDMRAAVPEEIVAQVRAKNDPIAELDEPGEEEHPADEFPTRETPLALETALRAALVPSTPKLPDATAPMPVAPPTARLDEILAAAPPAPSSISGPIALPAPPPPAIEEPSPMARLFVLPSDPPPARLVLVAVLSFAATLVLAAFVAWVVYLARH